MLPEFDEYGNLPPGIHRATVEEILQRFGTGSLERETEGRELQDFLEWARTVDIVRIIVDGSFVTSKQSPNDVDVAILPGPGYSHQELLDAVSEGLWPFVHVIQAIDESDFLGWAKVDFALGRDTRVRGVVEVVL